MRKVIVAVIVCISMTVGFVLGNSFADTTRDVIIEEPQDSITLLPEHPYYLLEEVNDTVLYKTLQHYGFPHPEIITAQAILESGNFKSRLCLEHNNLFGLYDSSKQSYMVFDSWISSVFAYKKYILNKYDGKKDYLQFLANIGYAENMQEYNKHIKELAKKYKSISDRQHDNNNKEKR